MPACHNEEFLESDEARLLRILAEYGHEYWREIVNFQALVRHRMIAEEDLGLVRFVDSPAVAFDVLRQGLETATTGATPDIARWLTSAEGPGHDAPASPAAAGETR
jgi:hypothetical protein